MICIVQLLLRGGSTQGLGFRVEGSGGWGLRGLGLGVLGLGLRDLGFGV